MTVLDMIDSHHCSEEYGHKREWERKALLSVWSFELLRHKFLISEYTLFEKLRYRVTNIKKHKNFIFKKNSKLIKRLYFES